MYMKRRKSRKIPQKLFYLQQEQQQQQTKTWAKASRFVRWLMCRFKLVFLCVCAKCGCIRWNKLNECYSQPNTKCQTIKLCKKHKLFSVQHQMKGKNTCSCPDLYRQCTFSSSFLSVLFCDRFFFVGFWFDVCVCVCLVARFYLVRSLISLSNVSRSTERAKFARFSFFFFFFFCRNGSKAWVRAWNVIRYLLWKPLTRKLF